MKNTVKYHEGLKIMDESIIFDLKVRSYVSAR